MKQHASQRILTDITKTAIKKEKWPKQTWPPMFIIIYLFLYDIYKRNKQNLAKQHSLKLVCNVTDTNSNYSMTETYKADKVT